MASHAEFGPSAAHRWMKCAASWHLGKKYVQGPTRHTAEGTLFHGLVELALRDATKISGLGHLQGQVRKVDGFDIEITEEMIAAVGACCLFIEERIEAYLCSEYRLGLEQRVELDSECWGTADAILDVKSEPLEIMDWKYGVGYEVPAEHNEQLAIYAVAARKMFRGGRGEVRAFIFQPRISEEPKEWLITSPILDSLENQVLKSIQFVKEHPNHFEIGEHCQFCPAKPVCPEQHKQALMVAQQEFGAAELARPDELGEEQLIKVLTFGASVRRWIESVEQYGLDRLLAGEEIPGFKVVRGRSNRRWKEGVTETHLMELGVDDPVEKKLKTITQVEKQIGKGRVGHLVEKPPGRPTLAFYGDKRPAIESVDPGEEFNE